LIVVDFPVGGKVGVFVEILVTVFVGCSVGILVGRFEGICVGLVVIVRIPPPVRFNWHIPDSAPNGEITYPVSQDEHSPVKPKHDPELQLLHVCSFRQLPALSRYPGLQFEH